MSESLAAITSGPSPTLLVAFFAGLISFLSPCVLPLVPGYLSLMTGLQPDDVASPASDHRRRLLMNTALFVIGFTVVFVAYGAVASQLGSLLLSHRTELTRVAGVFIIVTGLVVSGVLRIQPLLQTRRLHVSPARFGPYAAPVMGMAFAFGWTPCIGPVLASVLTLAAGRETLSEGVWLLLVYSAGLGVPFIVSGVAFARMRSTLDWFKRHGRMVDAVSGALLIVFGVLLLTGQLGRIATAVIRMWTALGFDPLTVG